jgi:uridylate kinase
VVARFVLKVSGEGLSGDRGFGTDPGRIGELAASLSAARGRGHELAVMVGGGNYFRGADASRWAIPRAEGDNVGILGTVINGILLRGALSQRGISEARLMTAVTITAMAEPYVRLRAERHLNKGRIVILAGGNGQPFVSTDYPAVQRALELEASRLLVAKNGISGVLTADPRQDSEARLLRSISHDDAVRRGLRVMDPAAFVLAAEHALPIQVFGVQEIPRLPDICDGADAGTLVAAGAPYRLA